MPPPNITGKLHLGHALFLTLQDILIRHHRIQGDTTLWLPGTDHAGLATHEKIINSLDSQTIDRRTYLEEGWKWKETHHSIITSQIKKMGASCDWSRERFTLDKDYEKSCISALKMCKDMLYFKDGQWYLNMQEAALELITAIENKEINIIPASETGQLLNFLKNIEPWCISRQIWWGQQLPIWFYGETICGDNYCIADNIQEASIILNISSENLKQCEDTLDTWFLSSLWPFATLGWPEKTKDYIDFYPAQLIETADDILFFWCARMLMMGKICTNKFPFKDIYLHGIIRDSKGRKMSKSLNNGIDPLDIIDKYGTDALRWALTTHTTAGQDMKISDQEFIAAKKFTNKLWQAGKFFYQHSQRTKYKPKQYSSSDYLKNFSNEYKSGINNYEFLQISTNLQFLFKHDFCDKWIEKNKQEIFKDNLELLQEGITIYSHFLKLFHPFIPFITEKIWEGFYDDSIMNQSTG